MSFTVRPLVATAGIAAVATAGLLRFAVVPAQAQLPADLDVTRSYTGTITSMLDAEALATGDFANAVLRDVPVTITRDLTAVSTQDGTATVAEEAVIATPDGTPLLTTSTDHVVDRRTMEAADEREGLLIGWPIGTEARDYTGWSSDLAAPIDLTYVRTEEHAGVETMVFEANYRGRIVSEETLSRLPAALPTSILPVAAEALGVSPTITDRLPALLERLPEQVALAYDLQSTTTYWVEPQTGIVVDLDREEHRYVSLDAEGVPGIPLADVFGMTYTGETGSVDAAVADATAAASQLRLFGTTLPIGLLVAGLALLAVSVRRRKTVDLTGLDTPAETTRERVNA